MTQNLRTLKLWNESVKLAANDPPEHLPNLRHFDINDSAPNVLDILSHITFPSTTSLTIHIIVEEDAFNPESLSQFGSIARMLGKHTGSIRYLAMGSWGQEETCCLEVWTHAGTQNVSPDPDTPFVKVSSVFHDYDYPSEHGLVH